MKYNCASTRLEKMKKAACGGSRCGVFVRAHIMRPQNGSGLADWEAPNRCCPFGCIAGNTLAQWAHNVRPDERGTEDEERWTGAPHPSSGLRETPDDTFSSRRRLYEGRGTGTGDGRTGVRPYGRGGRETGAQVCAPTGAGDGRRAHGCAPLRTEEGRGNGFFDSAALRSEWHGGRAKRAGSAREPARGGRLSRRRRTQNGGWPFGHPPLGLCDCSAQQFAQLLVR